MLPRGWRDDSPRGWRGDSHRRTNKPSSARRRSPSLSDDDDPWPPRREFSPKRHPRGPAHPRYPRESFEDPPFERPPRYSSPASYSPPPPRDRRSVPADPHRRHRRRRTTDDGPEYGDRRSRVRDHDRKQTLHSRDEGRKSARSPGRDDERRDIDDYLPRRYRSTTNSPQGRHGRHAATYPEPPRERAYSPPREYENRSRHRHGATRDERGRRRELAEEPRRHRRGRARSLDTEDRYRSRGSPRARSYGGHHSQPSKGASKSRFAQVAGDIPWGALASSAFQAGASAAYRARGDPGPWMGRKGTKVATVALGAALADTIGGGFSSGGKKKK